MDKKHRRESFLKKSVPLWAALVIFLILSGFAVALAVRPIPNVVKIGIWSGTIEESVFEVTSFEVNMKGKNTIEVSVTVHNTDNTATHSANVTVQLLDENGDMMMENNKDTGDVPGGESKEFAKENKYSFTQDNLVRKFEGVLIVIKDLT